MQSLFNDTSTIAALATPTGVGAVSLIRISGPAALAVANLATAGQASLMSPRTAHRCRIRDANGNVLDDGLMLVFRAPHSFTGEDCVEFSGHGGMLVTREVLARLTVLRDAWGEMLQTCNAPPSIAGVC